MLKRWAHPFKNFYLKTLRLSEKKHAASFLLFMISLRGFFIFAIPTDVVFIPLCLGNPKKCVKVFAPAAVAGTLIGAIIGYLLGYLIATPLVDWLMKNQWMTPAHWDMIIRFFNEYGILAIGLGVLTPVPFVLFTFSSGIFQFSVLSFLLTILISRGIKFYLQGILLYSFGEQIKEKIDQYFHYLFYALIVLTIFFIVYKIAN